MKPLEYGLNHRAVDYVQRALKTYRLVSRYFVGVTAQLPLQKLIDMGDIFMKAHMFESAQRMYARRIDPEKAYLYSKFGTAEISKEAKDRIFSGNFGEFFAISP